MKALSKSIILIGFKHVGKTRVGRQLASQLAQPFIDLDAEIERSFENEHQERSSCRDIIQIQGQAYFRALENEVLAEIMESRPSILSLGGGTPMNEENQKLIKSQIVIHLHAPRSLVFERIMAQGVPAFFSTEETPLDCFNRLWDERESIYKALASFSVDNAGTVESAVKAALKHLYPG